MSQDSRPALLELRPSCHGDPAVTTPLLPTTYRPLLSMHDLEPMSSERSCSFAALCKMPHAVYSLDVHGCGRSFGSRSSAPEKLQLLWCTIWLTLHVTSLRPTVPFTYFTISQVSFSSRRSGLLGLLPDEACSYAARESRHLTGGCRLLFWSSSCFFPLSLPYYCQPLMELPSPFQYFPVRPTDKDSITLGTSKSNSSTPNNRVN